MHQATTAAILFPMMAMVGLTFLVLLVIPFQRFRAVLGRQACLDDFAYGESAVVPLPLCLANRNFMNLLEMPVLFYLACLTHYVTAQVDAPALALAWGYVALRAAHSLVHLSLNHVLLRFGLFALSNLVLLGLWLRLLLALSGPGWSH